MRGVLVDDESDRLYVAHSKLGRVEVFDLSGNHLFGFGGLGQQPGMFPDGARQLAQLGDGTIWAADYGGRRVQSFTPDGTWLSLFPDPPMTQDPAGTARPRGIAVDPFTNDILVADSWSQRIQRFAPDGSLLRTFGQRGSKPPDGMNYPRSVAVDPATGNIWVPNYEGDPDLVIYDADFKFLKRIHTPRFVNDLEFVDGLAYVLIRRPGEVRVYDPTTLTLLSKCCSGLGFLRGIAVDSATGYMWITTDGTKDLYVIDRDGKLVRKLLVDGRGWGVTIVGDVVYVADSVANRILAYDRSTGTRIGQFGTPGSAAGQLRTPAGLTRDALGNLYVIEEGNSRVQVFTFDPPPAIEITRPSAKFDPAMDTTTLPFVVKGPLQDDTGVLLVKVLVQNEGTGLYWNAGNGMWVDWLSWNQGIVTGSPGSQSWFFTVVPSRLGEAYSVKVRAFDMFGNASNSVLRRIQL
jgi:DNA-binding beta-propeller fold protein YncE